MNPISPDLYQVVWSFQLNSQKTNHTNIHMLISEPGNTQLFLYFTINLIFLHYLCELIHLFKLDGFCCYENKNYRHSLTFWISFVKQHCHVAHIHTHAVLLLLICLCIHEFVCQMFVATTAAAAAVTYI